MPRLQTNLKPGIRRVVIDPGDSHFWQYAIVGRLPKVYVTGHLETLQYRYIEQRERFITYEATDGWAFEAGFCRWVHRPFAAGDPARLSDFWFHQADIPLRCIAEPKVSLTACGGSIVEVQFAAHVQGATQGATPTIAAKKVELPKTANRDVVRA